MECDTDAVAVFDGAYRCFYRHFSRLGSLGKKPSNLSSRRPAIGSRSADEVGWADFSRLAKLLELARCHGATLLAIAGQQPLRGGVFGCLIHGSNPRVGRLLTLLDRGNKLKESFGGGQTPVVLVAISPRREAWSVWRMVIPAFVSGGNHGFERI